MAFPARMLVAHHREYARFDVELYRVDEEIEIALSPQGMII